MSERTLLRLGGASAVVGALIALVANAVHPRMDDFADPVGGELRMVAGSDAWIAIHLAILVATLLVGFGLFAVLRSVKGGPADGAARVALGGVLVSVPVAVVALAVDGYAIKAVADSVGAAGGGTDLASTGAGVVAEVAWGMFMMLVIMLLGVAPALVAWAVALSGRYPAVYGWPVVAVGVAAAVTGVVGTVTGPSAGFFIAFVVTSGLATLWVLAIGATLWRRAGTAEGMEARPELAPS